MTSKPEDRKGKAEPKAKPAKDSQQQAQSGEGKQYGEGNYKATRDYNAGLKEHMQNHDIEREARDAAPKSDQEREDMERAERKGRDKAR